MTLSVRHRRQYDRFRRQLVWHPHNTDPYDQYRSGPRFWYPIYDLGALGLGLYATAYGSPLLNRLFPELLINSMGIFLIFASVICLIGVIFPILNILELAGKLAIVFALGAYAGTVAVLSRPDEPNGFVVIVLIMAVWLLGPRVSVLFVQVAKTPWLQRAVKRTHRRG